MAIGNHVADRVAEVLAADHEEPASLMARTVAVYFWPARRRGSSASRRRRRRAGRCASISTSSGPTRRLIAMVPDEQHDDQLGRLALVEDACRRPGTSATQPRSASQRQLVVGRAPRTGTASRSSSLVSRTPVRLRRSGSWRSQVAVGESHGHRALADGRGDPLDRVGAYVAGDEHAGDAGLQRPRVAVQRPAARPLPVDEQVGAGEQEAALVALERAGQPVGARLRADEDERVAGVDPLGRRRSARAAASAPRGGRRRAPRRPRCTSRTDTLSIASQLLDEVVRHAALERVARAPPA